MTITYRLDKGTPLTNTEVDQNFRDLANYSSNLESNVGVIGSLTTSVKSNLVYAVNEVRSLAVTVNGNVGVLTNLTTSAKSNIVAALNELQVLATGYTDSNARRSISVTGAGSYDNTTGVITITGGVTSVTGATGAISNVQIAAGVTSSGLLTTANLTELTNLFFTNARARQAISVEGAGSYDNTTGVITVTGGVTSVAGVSGAVSNAAIYAGVIAASGGGLYLDTSSNTQTKSGSLILSGNIQSIGGFVDSAGSRLLIKDQSGTVIWG